MNAKHRARLRVLFLGVLGVAGEVEVRVALEGLLCLADECACRGDELACLVEFVAVDGAYRIRRGPYDLA